MPITQGLVIPCYNEAERLPVAQVRRLLHDNPELNLLFVDDGSRDGTAELLASLAVGEPRVRNLILPQNQGKAEAVRQGLLQLLSNSHGDAYSCIGYADADFATPASELTRLLSVWQSRRPKVLLASRVRLLGTHIERLLWRHLLGRVFATFASMALQLPVYDTQCGAKFFETNAKLRECLSERFQSRWVFDVELMGRLCAGQNAYGLEDFIEVPLQKWFDVKGSKLKLSDMARAAYDLLKIGLRLQRARRQA